MQFPAFATADLYFPGLALKVELDGMRHTDILDGAKEGQSGRTSSE